MPDSFRDLHRAILRGHHAAFGIARHQADEIRAGRDFEPGAHRHHSILAIELDVLHQTKRDGIRDAFDMAAVVVEEAADHLNIVTVLAVDLAVMELGDIDLRYDG